MEIAILGLPQSGKSTIFEIMTGTTPGYGNDNVRGIAKVPDARFTKLVEIFKPAKVTPATIPFVDVNATGEDAWSQIRNSVSGADGLLHIVDGFTSDDVSDVIANYRKLADELILSDLLVIENRLTKILKLPKNALKPDEAKQAALLPKLKETLENGRSLRDMDLSPDEISTLRGFAFWTLRPELVVINVSEANPGISDEFIEKAGTNSPVIGICCQMEAEIAELPDEERKPFLEELGIESPAFERIIQTAFKSLSRMAYFTVGEDEVRAWVIPTGSTAPRAASAIHKDFERGFIRAEVVSYDDFMENGRNTLRRQSRWEDTSGR